MNNNNISGNQEPGEVIGFAWNLAGMGECLSEDERSKLRASLPCTFYASRHPDDQGRPLAYCDDWPRLCVNQDCLSFEPDPDAMPPDTPNRTLLRLVEELERMNYAPEDLYKWLTCSSTLQALRYAHENEDLVGIDQLQEHFSFNLYQFVRGLAGDDANNAT